MEESAAINKKVVVARNLLGKTRLDKRLQELYPQYSRQQIQSWIMQGKVIWQGEKLEKPGFMISVDAEPDCAFHQQKFVSRAGFKLEKALDTWNISVAEKCCLDAGISTGGFSDCLLQRGAKKIIGVDVGYGQLHLKVRNDPRVVLHERTNLRYLDLHGLLVDVVTLDLSFISVLKVMDAVTALMAPDGELIVLIKPQFEAGKQYIESGGLITKPEVHALVIETVCAGIKEYGFACIGVTESPIIGGSGNREFLGYFRRTS